MGKKLPAHEIDRKRDVDERLNGDRLEEKRGREIELRRT